MKQAHLPFTPLKCTLWGIYSGSERICAKRDKQTSLRIRGIILGGITLECVWV